MPAPLSNFAGTLFQIVFQNLTQQQTPKVLMRNEPKRMGSIRTSINGTISLQEIDRKWLPVVLVFSAESKPPALMSQAMVDAFKNAMNSGGGHTLNLEGIGMTVYFDWQGSGGKPVQCDEVTPTGEADPVTGRLYVGTIYFKRTI